MVKKVNIVTMVTGVTNTAKMMKLTTESEVTIVITVTDANVGTIVKIATTVVKVTMETNVTTVT
jgi:predicted Na+-dependent transporter